VNKTRRNRLIVGVVCLALVLSADPAKAASPARPNIVFLVSDDQDFAGIGAYGGHALTPHIDALAEEGMLFERAYVTSSACSPSRYAMLTGRLASRGTGEAFLEVNPPGAPAYITNNAIQLETDRPTFPAELQKAGYRTGFIGKWHLAPHNIQELGMKKFGRGPQLGDPAVDAAQRKNQAIASDYIRQFGFDVADRIYWNNIGEWNTHVDGLDAQNMEWMVEGALEFLDEVETAEEPFLLWFAMTQPHNPSGAVQDYAPLVGSERITPAGLLPTGELPDVMPPRESLKPRLAEAGVPARLPRDLSCQRYGNEYSLWIDDGVGAILDKLEAMGVADNTIVVYVSDNPTWGKFHTYERGTLVPQIIRWPGRIAPGAVNDRLFSNTDFAPTLLAAAGIEVPEDLGTDGMNQLPSLLEGEGVRESVFLEFGNSRAISDGEWKYIALRPTEPDLAFGQRINLPVGHWGEREGEGRFKGLAQGWREANLRFFPHYYEPDQLYHLAEDPMEQVNRIADPEVQDALDRLRLQMAEKSAAIGRPFGEFAPTPDQF